MINKYRNGMKAPGVHCPLCEKGGLQVEMIVQTRIIQNRRDATKDLKSQFLGCPNWPRCRGTKPITQEIQTVLDAVPAEPEYVQDW